MKILLCTPVFNGGNTLKAVYESILDSAKNISVKVLWVIANANSFDSTPKLIEQFISENPLDNLNIVHLQESDNGMYDAIRKVFDRYITQCEWMGWINCDDYLTPNCFHDLKAIDKYSEVKFVVSRRSVKYESGELITCSQGISTSSVSSGLHDGIYGNYVQQEGAFFRHNLWSNFKYKDTFASCKLAGDWFLWMHLAKSSQIYENIRSMGVFCKHAGQLSENLESYQNEINYLLAIEKRRQHREKLSTLVSNKFIVKYEKIYFLNHEMLLKK